MTKITKNLSTEVKDATSKGIVTIQITQFDKFDSDNDRVLKGALTKTWNEGSQVHLVNHSMNTSSYVGLPISKDASTGIIESQLNLNKQVGIDLLADYEFSQKHGRSLQHSHGFTAMKGKFDKNDKGGYDFTEIKQFEYSTVIYGAVSDTPLHAIKNKSENELIDLTREMELKLKFGNYSHEYCLLVEKALKDLKEILKEPALVTRINKDEPTVVTQNELNINELIKNLKN